MPHSSDSFSNQSSPFSRGTHPSAIIPIYSSNPYASVPPNQGGAGTTEQQQQSGPAIDPQSGSTK